MTDRELLEAAARAAGIEYDAEASQPHPKSGAFWGLWLALDGEPSDLQRRYWNPLRDDGDALRLAMKLRISPSFGGCATECQGWVEASYSNPRNSRTTVKERVQVAYVPEAMFHDPRYSTFAAYLMEDYGDELVRGFEVATRRAIVRAAAAIGAHKEGA